MFDFNQEDYQKELASGPIPAGSKVMLRMLIQKPKHESKPGSFVAEYKSGLLALWVKFEVVHGTYEGVSWYENLLLPVAWQRAAMSDSQHKACRISGSKLRAIVEAARGINPKDKGMAANNARHVHAVLDFDKMCFPARVGIDKEGREYKGKLFWNNTLGTVITPDKTDYQTIVGGGEIITDGPTHGETVRREGQGSDGVAGAYDDRFGGAAFPSESPDSDIPF